MIQKNFVRLALLLSLVVLWISCGKDAIGKVADQTQSSSKAITAFALAGNTANIVDSNKTITVTMPYGTSLSGQVATFTTTGVSVTIGTTVQVSGTTVNDFTSPVIYSVIAADGSKVNYTVIASVASSSAKAITAFSISGVNANIVDNSKMISATLPYGTDLTALVATFTTTGAKVSVDTTTQISGNTSNNFKSAVKYLVTAADGSTATYIVTLSVASNSAKAITSFSLATYVGVIVDSTKTISVAVPYGTSVSALAATYTTTGASVTIGSTVQVSGSTVNDFTSTVVYTVTAADGSSVKYTVSVNSGSCPAKTCSSYGFTCGTAADGCGGTLNCGTCSNPQTCGGSGTPNVCGVPACVPKTCNALGATCGSVGDGCGGTLACGTCSNPLTCGGSGTPNVCGLCFPKTCASQGATCGVVSDGCGGTLDCGPCI